MSPKSAQQFWANDMRKEAALMSIAGTPALSR
jgi:hypothetical protein